MDFRKLDKRLVTILRRWRKTRDPAIALDRHETPRVAIDITSGTAWSPDAEHDLMLEYTEAGHRLDPVINELFPPIQ